MDSAIRKKLVDHLRYSIPYLEPLKGYTIRIDNGTVAYHSGPPEFADLSSEPTDPVRLQFYSKSHPHGCVGDLYITNRIPLLHEEGSPYRILITIGGQTGSYQEIRAHAGLPAELADLAENVELFLKSQEVSA